MILSFSHVCLAFFDLVTSFIKHVSPPWSLTLSSLFYVLVYVVPSLLIICRCSHCLFQSLFRSAWPPTLASLCAEAHSSQFSKLSPSSHLNNSCHKLSQSLSFGQRYENERNCISMSLFTKGWYPEIVTLSKAHKPRSPQGCCLAKGSNSSQCDKLSILSTTSEVIWCFVVVEKDFRTIKDYFVRKKKIYLVKIWLHVSVWMRTDCERQEVE